MEVRVKKTKNNEKGVAGKREIYLLSEKESPFEMIESFRNVMTNISFAIPKKADGIGKIISLSSSQPGEGKTTMAVNLALTYANSGAKTILLDCDMRKPQIQKYFRLYQKTGLTAFLSGQVNLESVICREVLPNLDVIVCGKSAPNPIVLLNSDNFDSLLNRLSAEYDYVIIDTPPIGTVVDGSIIASKTDGIVIVVRQMITTHKLLQGTINSLTFSDCNLLGFILNDFKTKRSGYYYDKYKYGYKYSYKYDYCKQKNREE